jgi:hypothetical protein
MRSKWVTLNLLLQRGVSILQEKKESIFDTHSQDVDPTTP